MHRLLHIYFGNELAALVDHDGTSANALFEWLPDFARRHANLTSAFDTTDRNAPVAFGVAGPLPSPLRDVLPGRFARQLLAASLQRSGRPVDSLNTLSWLALSGSRGMGGFRFEPSGFPELQAIEPVDPDRLVRYARHLEHENGVALSEKRLRELLRVGLTVRGKSPKVMVAVNDFNGSMMSGQGEIPMGFEAWMLKLDGIRNGSGAELALEYEYYLKAKAAGLYVAESRILKDGNWKHLMVKRFDRESKQKRLCFSLSSWSSGVETGWDDAFRRSRMLRLPFPDMEELFRRMCFASLTGHEDLDPDRMFFIFRPEEGWRLAPAFNLKPAYLGQASGRLAEGKMERHSDETRIRFGKNMGIKKAAVLHEQIRQALVSQTP